MRCSVCTREKDEGEGWVFVSKNIYGYQDNYRHEVCPEKVCKELVTLDPGARFASFKVCGRDAKGQGQGKAGQGLVWKCGIHLAAERRRKANDVKWKTERDASSANSDRAKLAGDILQELGVDSRAYFSWQDGRSTGDIVVDPAQLFEALGIGVKLPDKIEKEKK